MGHIPSYKNKAADCLSRLPFVTRKRNNNPLKDEEISINANHTKENATCCPMCEVDGAHPKALQQNDRKTCTVYVATITTLYCIVFINILQF